MAEGTPTRTPLPGSCSDGLLRRVYDGTLCVLLDRLDHATIDEAQRGLLGQLQLFAFCGLRAVPVTSEADQHGYDVEVEKM